MPPEFGDVMGVRGGREPATAAAPLNVAPNGVPNGACGGGGVAAHEPRRLSLSKPSDVWYSLLDDEGDEYYWNPA